MNVATLIEYLKTMPQDAKVLCYEGPDNADDHREVCAVLAPTPPVDDFVTLVFYDRQHWGHKK